MKLSIKSLLMIGILSAAPTAFGQGQLMTWLQGRGSSGGLTNVLSTNQVMEILSVSLDTSGQIDVTAGTQTVSFGGSGNLGQPTPFVIAGPASVIFRENSSGNGGFVTYRISNQNSSAQK